MQKVEVIASGHFTDTRIGSVSRKQRLFIPLNVAEDLHSIGLVQYANPQAATATQNPQSGPLAAGGGMLSASLPAAQALPPKTVIRFHKQDGEQLPPTTVIEERPLPMLSTPATGSGGESITKKRGRPSKASYGLKTSKPQENLEFTE